jgi:hypothetical protein
MRLVWITDPRFNFLPPFGAHAFGPYVAKETECDAVVLTGDIAESNSLEEASEGFAKGLGKPVYFVSRHFLQTKGCRRCVPQWRQSPRNRLPILPFESESGRAGRRPHRRKPESSIPTPAAAAQSDG